MLELTQYPDMLGAGDYTVCIRIDTDIANIVDQPYVLSLNVRQASKPEPSSIWIFTGLAVSAIGYHLRAKRAVTRS